MLRDIGRGAEDIGLNSIWLGEHVVLFGQYGSRYPGNPSGRGLWRALGAARGSHR